MFVAHPVIRIITTTLQKTAAQHADSDTQRAKLQALATQIEHDWNAPTCPLCQQTACSHTCPLSGLRADPMWQAARIHDR